MTNERLRVGFVVVYGHYFSVLENLEERNVAGMHTWLVYYYLF